MRSSLAADRALGWLLPVLAILAEGALLAVVYAAVETSIDRRPPLLGPFEFAVAAGVAALAVHRRWLDPDEDPLRFLGLLAALGLVGWMWDDTVRELVLSGDPVAALSLHPGGWLAVVAGMRGTGRGVDIDDRAMTRLVMIGVPALAIPWVIGQLTSGSLRDRFTEDAFVASLTFITTGFMAAGLARLREIGRETGVDWRRNRSWLGTVAGVLLAVLALGIPASILFGLPGDALARGILGPIVSVLAYLFVAGMTLAAIVAAILAQGLQRLGVELPAVAPEALDVFNEVEPYTVEEMGDLITGLVALWAAIAVVLIVLARFWLRRRVRRGVSGGGDRRSFRLPQRSRRVGRERSRPPSPVRRGSPTDAVTAYLASLDEIAGHRPDAARAEHETPRGHAVRVDVGPELGALQADYALARYGDRELTSREHGRALQRWQRLRRRLRSTS